MTARFAKVNGVSIAYRMQGEGPPLVLVMGYRLNSTAWPPAFVERLARKFTIITLDNRGTGLSDKPVKGYAIANMARDVCGLLDELGLPRVHMLGYSMGGTIAQEFVRQFPERVLSLILCATLAGGLRATYARASVVSVMRELDGLSPEEAARRIWKVTYSPHYLERYQALAEAQMRREIAQPTPLHAADLQFQAFAEFNGSRALAEISCPTLILTGDLDELIPPQNSAMMAKLIPAARLVVIRGVGHRVFWEATERCVALIADFLTAVQDRSTGISVGAPERSPPPAVSSALSAAIELLAMWPLALAQVGFNSFALARQSMLSAGVSGFGDGKPIILCPPALSGGFALLPFSVWLKGLGYRPVIARAGQTDQQGGRSIARAVRDVVQRVGRKAVLITHSSGLKLVLQTAASYKEWVSDVVVVGGHYGPSIVGVRVHSVSMAYAALLVPQLLRGIEMELVEAKENDKSEGRPHEARHAKGMDAEELMRSEGSDG
jgi:pimeloyl-ACP methyl ester carboxylesterase